MWLLMILTLLHVLVKETIVTIIKKKSKTQYATSWNSPFNYSDRNIQYRLNPVIKHL